MLANCAVVFNNVISPTCGVAFSVTRLLTEDRVGRGTFLTWLFFLRILAFLWCASLYVRRIIGKVSTGEVWLRRCSSIDPVSHLVLLPSDITKFATEESRTLVERTLLLVRLLIPVIFCTLVSPVARVCPTNPLLIVMLLFSVSCWRCQPYQPKYKPCWL
jgi:hypothetical protein